MKVLFLIQDESLPSSRVRVLDLRADLEAHGLSVAVEVYPRSLAAKWGLLAECARHDVVFVQKKLPTALDRLWLRRSSRRLVYDFDDAVYFRHDSPRGIDHPTGRRRFRGIARRVDLVVAGNRFLAEAARPLARRVEVVPSAVETRGAPRREHAEGSGPLVIGWVGSRSTLAYAASLGPILRSLAKDIAFEYRIVSSEGLSIDGVRTVFVPWSSASQAAEIARFDIGVMPLPRTPHSEGKCAYKALQYMAAGVPAVVSDVGVNREVVADAGMVAGDFAEFGRHLRTLAAEVRLRRELGDRGRLIVQRSFSVESIAGRLAAILRSLMPDAEGRG